MILRLSAFNYIKQTTMQLLDGKKNSRRSRAKEGPKNERQRQKVPFSSYSRK
jgi:hypothetical protein